MLQSRTNKHALNIIDRPLARNKLDIPTVSLSAFAYLFSELISYAMDRAASITELEDRCGRGRFVLCDRKWCTMCCPTEREASTWNYSTAELLNCAWALHQ